MKEPALDCEVAPSSSCAVVAPRDHVVRDTLITALAPLAWGATYLVTSQFLPPNRPLLLGVLRALPVGIVFTLRSGRLPSGIWWWRFLVLGILNVGAAFALLFLVAYRLPGGVGGTLSATQPLVVVFLAWLVLGERPTAQKVLAAAIGFVGVSLLVLGHITHLDVAGLTAGLCQPFIIGMGTVLTQRWGRPLPLLAFTGWQLVVGGVMLAPFAFLLEGPLPHFTTVNVLSLAYLAVFGTGVAYFAWFRGIERISASSAAFLVLLVPVIAAGLDSLVLHRHLRPIQLFGIAMVLVSVFAVTRSAARARRDDAPPA
ncbi:MAG: EamA family transporter [Candidatus Binatia bacterium]